MMGFLFDYGVEIIAGLVLLLLGLYFYLTKNHAYWQKKGVPFVEPQIPFGIMAEQVKGKADSGTVFNKIYTKYKKQGLKYVGAFTLTQPTLIILDLDLCKYVLTKDFNHFVTRDMFPTSHEYISKHLFSLEGHEWKDMRTKLTPTFTSGKMKTMFTLMTKCAEQLQDHIENKVLKVGEFEVKNLIARFTTDIIATCAFGIEVNSIKEEDNEFFKIGQKIFLPKLTDFFTMFYHKNFPTFSKIIRVNAFHPSISQMLTKLMRDTVEYRKQNNVARNDFVDLLLKVKENRSLEDHEDHDHLQGDDKTTKHSSLFSKAGDPDSHEPDRLTLEEMTAQAFVFFAAGFETAASTTSFCLYELAKNPEVQERLRREIDEVLSNHGGEITYQSLQDMTFMDQVMNETLRMYASLPFLTRVCTEPYQVPGTDLVIDKDVRVSIPTYAIHHDPDIYPDPYNFDPERFSEENIRDRHHYAFIPFGEGPRICIGMRFGKLQVKLGLAAILSRYELSPAPDTPSRLEIDTNTVFTIAKHPYRLKIANRRDL